VIKLSDSCCAQNFSSDPLDYQIRITVGSSFYTCADAHGSTLVYIYIYICKYIIRQPRSLKDRLRRLEHNASSILDPYIPSKREGLPFPTPPGTPRPGAGSASIASLGSRSIPWPPLAPPGSPRGPKGSPRAPKAP